MQYIVHVMLFCFSYFYLTEPLFYHRNRLFKNNAILKSSSENHNSDMTVEINNAGYRSNNQHSNQSEGRDKNLRRRSHYKKRHHHHHNSLRELDDEDIPETKQVLRHGLPDASIRSFSDSDDREEPKFKLEERYKKEWAQLQLEVMNMSAPGGDDVFMTAARPWGVPCGDPNQHDAPWGTCMLSSECESEYRIYRADRYCGRTSFVCCALLDNAYDLNMPFDASFGDTEFAENSEEKRFNMKYGILNQHEDEQKGADTKRRQDDRNKRKLAITSLIEEIQKQLRLVINKSERNNTKMKYKRKKQLTIFLSELKLQYKKDRQAVRDVQEVHVIKIDKTLRDRLNQLMKVNRDFLGNADFREIVTHALESMAMLRTDALKLMKAYPELQPYFLHRRDNRGKQNMFQNDVEYGLLYY